MLFVTPEYNRSVPAVLKNALDVGSRPYGSSVWDRKPGAIVSSSPGAIGAFGANHHLRQSLVFLNVPTMQQPEAYVGHVDKLFDEHGKLVSDGTRKFLQEFMQAFANWVETIPISDGAQPPGEAQNRIGRISSNSSRHASLKSRNRSIVPSMAISRSSTKLLSGSR